MVTKIMRDHTSKYTLQWQSLLKADLCMRHVPELEEK